MEFLPVEKNGLKVYAGFWHRIIAGIVDGIVLAIFAIIVFNLESTSITVEIIASIILHFVFVVYTIYFHFRFGATLGKMVSKIQVTLPNGSAIGLKQAVLRSSVDIVFSIFATTASVIAISSVSPDDYLSLGWVARAKHVEPFTPKWSYPIAIGGSAWVWSEYFVVLLNRRKRAIHDFIAGTVVISLVTLNTDSEKT